MIAVLALLGGGMMCLLVINTTLAAASFRIADLQRSNAAAAQQVQLLQQQVARESSPGAIAQQAYRLGMRTPATLNFLDLRTGRRYSQPHSAAAAGGVPAG